MFPIPVSMIIVLINPTLDIYGLTAPFQPLTTYGLNNKQKINKLLAPTVQSFILVTNSCSFPQCDGLGLHQCREKSRNKHASYSMSKEVTKGRLVGVCGEVNKSVKNDILESWV